MNLLIGLTVCSLFFCGLLALHFKLLPKNGGERRGNVGFALAVAIGMSLSLLGSNAEAGIFRRAPRVQVNNFGVQSHGVGASAFRVNSFGVNSFHSGQFNSLGLQRQPIPVFNAFGQFIGFR